MKSPGCVVLLSRSCDAELDAVGRLLAGVGVPTVRLDADALAGVDLLLDPLGCGLRLRGRWLTPTVVWNRHFSVRAIRGSGDRVADLALRDTWQELAGQLETLAVVRLPAATVGPLDQLRIAAESGIAVPRTLVATDLRQAAATFGTARVVVKALHPHFVEAEPGCLTGRFPAVARPEDLARLGSGPSTPMLVQEYVAHEAELRVYHVRGHSYAFAVGKSAPADPWLAPERVTVRRVEPSATVCRATRALADALSLRFAAFDFLLHDGVPVFLEANADGDWRWVEVAAGGPAAPVTTAAAAMLGELHRSAARALGVPEGDGAGGFDVTGFLAARVP